MKKLSAIVNVTAKMPICVVMSKRNTIISSAWSDLPIVSTILKSTIANPSFFFEINGNREVS